MRRGGKDPFAREKRKRYRPSLAAQVRTCVRRGICKEWLDSLNQDWLQSVLKRPEPKLTRIYPRKEKANTAKLQRTSTLASQSLRACSTRMKKLDDDLKGSDQYQTTPDSDQFDTQEMQSQKTGIQSSSIKYSYKEKYLETKAELSKAKEQIKELRKKYKDYQTTLDSDKFDTQGEVVV
ncbi:PREDICTED: uncharacterized protein LOC104730880 isoform X2 [Camelina sativa]|uniref:Uncharacterized protein LOC104730880 isoform X2 n=1 Tax=Camelina sativa TaxID=90675 RepID=A0ABM1QRD1_CAMSA|nr:PREDICTED: uncharacterized protein LOC104730880 isoform X2 [Camelina sativa]